MSVEAGPRSSPAMVGHNRILRTTANGKERRVSRACVSCRLRKTRCDLDYGGNPGIPPCRRCVREQKECILATSRRGGRRPRKPVHPPESDGLASSGFESAAAAVAAAAPPTGDTHGSLQQHSTPGSRRHRRDDEPWSGSPGDEEGDEEEEEEEAASSSPGARAASWPASGSQPNSPGARSLQSSGDIEGHITSSDLLNPSDALNLLAQVAHLDGDGGGAKRDRKPSDGGSGGGGGGGGRGGGSSSARDEKTRDGKSLSSKTTPSYHYPPISDGVLTLAVASELLTTYYQHYHPFFPVADKCILSPPSVQSLTETEPHLVTAIFTVVSKDEPSLSAVHEACSRHMETLISKLIYKGSTTVGAVEALLILAQWAPQRLQEKPTVGRGEEDEGAWMQIGVAIRLGYLQSLEQTGLLVDKQNCLSEQFRRKRMVWAACYMSDREVSIRVGKGFWSRGPGPSTIPRSADFPSLRVQKAGSDNLAQLFQAQLELIQLFSNAHDILYSSAGHRAQLYLGGEYVRYIDDFFAVLRKWKLVWGSLSFTPLIKAGLNLSYEFLRLYINAFAFQATINRAINRARQQALQKPHPPPPPPPQQHQNHPLSSAAAAAQPSRQVNAPPLFSDLASAPDARFIYESMDAANSLLNILNTSVDPATGLRYMPLKYYLYVIYAAVFLFKARLAGALGNEASDSVRRSISVTISCLQRSSVSAHSLGQRYARLLSLLWRTDQPPRSRPRKEPEPTAASTTTTTTNATNTVPGPEEVGPHPPPPSSGPPPASAAATTLNMPDFRPHDDDHHHDQHNLVLTDAPHPVHGHSHGHGHGQTHPAAAYGVVHAPVFPPQPELQLCRGFSWRDLDDLGQFIGPADVGFSDPSGLQVAGGIVLDDGAAYDVLWPGNDVVF